MTALDLVTAALQEMGAAAQGEQASAGDAQFALQKLNSLLDSWAARKVYIYGASLPTFALVPGLLPHTIGPLGQLTESERANNVATFFCSNNLANGQNVTVASQNGLSVTGNAQAATAAKFSVAADGADVALAADAGTVLPNLPGLSGGVPTFATPGMGPRPQRVEQATLILTDSNPAVELPLAIWDAEQWMSERVKALQSNVPIALYYDATWPNGSLYFWPVPSFAYGARLKLWSPLQSLPALSYQFSLPPGYQEALIMRLAKNLCGSFQAQWSATQEDALRMALKAVEANNVSSPKGATGDAGMPGIGARGDFNYYSGMPR